MARPWLQRRSQRESDSSRPLSTFLILAGCGLLGAIVTAWELGPIQFLDRQTQTWFAEWRGSVPPPSEIVILAIDDQSLSVPQNYGDDPSKKELVRLLQNFPWRREAYAQAIDYLSRENARVIALDLLFDLPSGYGDGDDRRFAQSLQQHRDRVVLAAAYQESPGLQGSLDYIEPNTALRQANPTIGLVNFLPPEADGRVHRLGSAFRERVLRSLDLPLFPSFAEQTLQTAKISYPPARGEGIYFYGGPGNIQRISFWKVLAPDWQEVFRREGTFRNKIVLIGTTTDSADSDVVRTPFADKMPGVELHANAIASLLQGRTIAPVFESPGLNGLAILALLLGMGAGMSLLAKRPVWQLMAGLTAAILWGTIAYLLFNAGFRMIPVAVPIAAIGLGSFTCFTLAVSVDELERRRLRRTLERYIAAPVVREILKQPESMPVHQKLRVAVLFADIRGFTSLSYKLPPEQLIQQLNRYFDAMVGVIIRAGGTVDKFIGDAVMAEFGFPISRGEAQDAIAAVRAALEMRRSLANLRQQFISEGLVPFFNGIGISFGDVIAGDLGSLQRREYGVIGDTVNTASRVEGMTKQFWTDILITESLYELVKDQVEVVYVGEHALRGRDGTIKLYSVIGCTPEDRVLYQQVMNDLRGYLGTRSPTADG